MKSVVYCRDNCIWCDRAMELLNSHNVSYEIVKIYKDISLEDFRSLMNYPEKLTVPQIYMNDVLIGGYEDLQRYYNEQDSSV